MIRKFKQSKKYKETSKEIKYANFKFNKSQEGFWEKGFLQVHRCFYDQSEQVWKTLS